MRLPKIALVAASVAFTFSSTAVQAANCQPGTAGCVLPLPGPAPTVSVPVETTAVPVGEAIVEEGGFNALPFILGAIALAAIAYFLLFDDDEEDTITP
jgi:hypothetical protein